MLFTSQISFQLGLREKTEDPFSVKGGVPDNTRETTTKKREEYMGIDGPLTPPLSRLENSDRRLIMEGTMFSDREFGSGERGAISVHGSELGEASEPETDFAEQGQKYEEGISDEKQCTKGTEDKLLPSKGGGQTPKKECARKLIVDSPIQSAKEEFKEEEGKGVQLTEEPKRDTPACSPSKDVKTPNAGEKKTYLGSEEQSIILM